MSFLECVLELASLAVVFALVITWVSLQLSEDLRIRPQGKRGRSR